MSDSNLTIRDQHALPTPPESGQHSGVSAAITKAFNEGHRVLEKLSDLPDAGTDS